MGFDPSCWKEVRAWVQHLQSRKDDRKKFEGFEAWRKEVKSAPIKEVIAIDTVRIMQHDEFRERILTAKAKSDRLLVQLFPIRHQDLLSSDVSTFAQVHIEGEGDTQLTIRGAKIPIVSARSAGSEYLVATQHSN